MLKRTITLVLFFLILFTPTVLAQTVILKGTVVDSEGTPLPGVSARVKNTSRGGMTSIDGKYAISGVAPTDSIEFTYVGFETQVHLAGNNQILDIVMLEDGDLLEEVTVVAFQRQKSESVIASVSTLNPKELRVPQSNMTTAFAGKIAGVISYQRSGEPGQDNAEFFIRGVTTFGYGNRPLILIDGLESSTEDLARMEPDNVESFSIMKDATATALYGARGANGVILVTTKTGRKGKMQVSARVDARIATPTRMNKFLDGVSYMEMYNEAARMRNPEQPLYYSKYKIEGTRNDLHPVLYPNVDWYSELFNNSVDQYHANINASGGGDVARYYLSVGYTNEKGLLKVDPVNNFNNNININRFNIRANIDFDLTKTTKAALKYYALFDRRNTPATDASEIFRMVMNANPVSFPKTFDRPEDFPFIKHTMFGNAGDGRADAVNPYAEMVRGYRDRFNATNQVQFQINQDLSAITKGLNVRALFSMNVLSTNQMVRRFTPFYYGVTEIDTESGPWYLLRRLQEGTESLSVDNANTWTSATSNFYFETATQYNRKFADKHDIGGLLVFYTREELNDGGGEVLASLPVRNMGISGRATYGYDSRYYIEANFGYNGSEKFDAGHRWGFFPSIGAGWNVSNEHFYGEGLKKILSQVKLKATYGLVGNDAIAAASNRFFYLSQVNTNDGGKRYSWGKDYDQSYNGYVVRRYANPEVSWEVAQKANYGLELSFWNKLNIHVDYFTEKRSGIYFPYEFIPTSMGLSAGLSNSIGKTESNGVEVSSDFSWSVNKDLWFSARGNFTYATNKMLANGEPEYNHAHMSRINQPINQQWGFVAERLFIDEEDRINSPDQFGRQNAAQDAGYMPGDIKYVDITGDGKIDNDDMVPIGHPSVPEIIYGFGLSSGWKNIDFSFFFQGSARSSFFIDPTKIAPFVGSNNRNALKVITDNYWSYDNPDPNAFWPRLSVENVANNNVPSTWWLRDGRFLRLKTVELGYSLPMDFVRKYGITSARFYVTGDNLLCFSKFKMWDPEMGDNGLGYPTQKIYNVGFQFSF